MSAFRHSTARMQFMSARTVLILSLVLSLLAFSQARPATVPAEMKQGGACAGMACSQPCCANKVCCQMVEEQRLPQNSGVLTAQPQLPLALLGLRAAITLFTPPARQPAFISRDKTRIPYTLPPLAVNCIRLI